MSEEVARPTFAGSVIHVSERRVCDDCEKTVGDLEHLVVGIRSSMDLNPKVFDFCNETCFSRYVSKKFGSKPETDSSIVTNHPMTGVNQLFGGRRSTGNSRLDDLLLGGFPAGTNCLIMGPAFIGKEVLTNGFLVEGRGNGEKTIVLNTDCAPDDIESEWEIMTDGRTGHGNLPDFIDVYSKPMGLDISPDAKHIYLTDPNDFDEIPRAIASLSKNGPFCLVVRSASTLISYSDAPKVYRFLQQLTSLVKKTDSVALYLLDPGMHTDPEIQTLAHLMDGRISFETNGVKTFLSIEGICDVQSRSKIQYQYSKRGLTLGSFCLDKIDKK